MNLELLLPVSMRWLHLLAAIIAVGGMVFLRFVLMPAARDTLTNEQHAALREQVIGRWGKFVMVSIAVLLVTGFYNFMTVGVPKGKEVPSYHMLFGLKLLLALAVFVLGSALTGRAAVFAGVRAKANLWLTVSTLLAIAVVLLAGLLSQLGGGEG